MVEDKTATVAEMTNTLKDLLETLKKSPNPGMVPFVNQLEDFLKKKEKANKEIRKVEVAANMVTTSAAA